MDSFLASDCRESASYLRETNCCRPVRRRAGIKSRMPMGRCFRRWRSATARGAPLADRCRRPDSDPGGAPRRRGCGDRVWRIECGARGLCPLDPGGRRRAGDPRHRDASQQSDGHGTTGVATRVFAAWESGIVPVCVRFLRGSAQFARLRAENRRGLIGKSGRRWCARSAPKSDDSTMRALRWVTDGSRRWQSAVLRSCHPRRGPMGSWSSRPTWKVTRPGPK